MPFMAIIMPFTEETGFSRKGSCRVIGGGGGVGGGRCFVQICQITVCMAEHDVRMWAQFKRSGAFHIQARQSRQLQHLWELPLVSTLPSIIFFKKATEWNFFFFFFKAQHCSAFGAGPLEDGSLQQGLGCRPGSVLNATACHPSTGHNSLVLQLYSLNYLFFFFFLAITMATIRII